MKKSENQDQIQKLQEEEALILEKGKPSEEKLCKEVGDRQSKIQQGFFEL